MILCCFRNVICIQEIGSVWKIISIVDSCRVILPHILSFFVVIHRCSLILPVVLLQEKKLLELPKLLDICAIYYHENEELTRSLVRISV